MIVIGNSLRWHCECASLESITNRESYETGPHFVSYFDNFRGPVDSFGTDRLIRLAVFQASLLA